MTDSITTSATPPEATAPITVEDMPYFWPLIALEAWILTRDPSAVEAICRTPSDVDKVSVLLSCRRRSDTTIQAVRREIRRHLRSGKVPALGDRGDGHETVPAVDLSMPFEYLPKTCAYKVGKYGNLGVTRDEALKRWPPHPPAAVQNDHDLLEAGLDAISEPVEFETKARDVQQEPEEALVEDGPAAVAAAQDKPKRKNKWGRPPFDYKEEVINETVKWLDDEGEERPSKIIEFMRELIAKKDDEEGACHSTMKNWANDALARFRRQAQQGLRRPTGDNKPNAA